MTSTQQRAELQRRIWQIANESLNTDLAAIFAAIFAAIEASAMLTLELPPSIKVKLTRNPACGRITSSRKSEPIWSTR